jgi:hypothetical protein
LIKKIWHACVIATKWASRSQSVEGLPRQANQCLGAQPTKPPHMEASVVRSSEWVWSKKSAAHFGLLDVACEKHNQQQLSGLCCAVLQGGFQGASTCKCNDVHKEAAAHSRARSSCSFIRTCISFSWSQNTQPSRMSLHLHRRRCFSLARSQYRETGAWQWGRVEQWQTRQTVWRPAAHWPSTLTVQREGAASLQGLSWLCKPAAHLQ